MIRLLLAMLAVIGACLPARAALTLCNRTSYILYAATAAISAGRIQTQGWTRIAPGDCQLTRKEPLSADRYLVYARSSLAHSGPVRAWGGTQRACVKDGNFVLQQTGAAASCREESFFLPFALLDHRGSSVWTMNFDEQPAMSLSQAQLAGVKRLLKDNGYAIAHIDDTPDKATGAALSDFRKRMRFSPTAGNVELFTALERQAALRIAPQGYTVCNQSGAALLVALGQRENGLPVSRGWWSIPPKACARAETQPLTVDRVYLLAQRKSGTILVGGTQSFCTSPAAFEIRGSQDCAARGFGRAGFAATRTGGHRGYRARIGAAGLDP